MRPYDREAELPWVLPLWPTELADTSRAGRLRILRKLRAALRQFRKMGLAGHWAYDLPRHMLMLRVYRHERALYLADRRRHPASLAEAA